MLRDSDNNRRDRNRFIGLAPAADIFVFDFDVRDPTSDIDQDGIVDGLDQDMDGDGIFNFADDDIDGDGYPNIEDSHSFDPIQWSDFNANGLSDQLEDSDDDGVLDADDPFPLDPNESLDTDGDGIGNNTDEDDDGDGFSDEQELVDGTNPLSGLSCASGCFSFDIDENNEAKALSDGLLVIRHLFGFSGSSLTNGAADEEGARTSAEAVSSYLSDADAELDIDGDGESKPLTDGLLLIRYLFGFSGGSLTAGAIGSEATRATAEEIESYIEARTPSN